MKYKVHYEGFYIIESDSIDAAIETDRDDADVEFEQWENIDAELWEE